MPSTSRCGVDRVLPKVSALECSSNTAMSVKVPPMSAASRTWVRRTLGRRTSGRDCFFAANLNSNPVLSFVMPGDGPASTLFVLERLTRIGAPPWRVAGGHIQRLLHEFNDFDRTVNRLWGAPMDGKVTSTVP